MLALAIETVFFESHWIADVALVETSSPAWGRGLTAVGPRCTLGPMLERACLLLVATSGLAACNLITGAADLEVDGSEGGGTALGGAGQGNAPNGPSGPGSGGNGAAPGVGGGDPSGGSSAVGIMCPTCAANEHCDGATGMCVCDPGFTDNGGGCVAADPGDPTNHTAAEVCQRWQDDHVLTDNDPFSSSGAQCDSGTLSQGGLDDTLVRLNLFRWLSGLGPTFDDPALNAMNQKCANLESWWDWSLPNSPHDPPPGVTCYSADGDSGAGQSNIAWGNGPAQSIDQFMEDSGNETTMGHRRWIVNPPLGPVGIGYWEGGGMYGSAECLAVFGSSGTGPNPPWVAVPNQGFTPLTIAQWTWTFHGPDSGIPTASVTMLRVDDNTPLAVNVLQLSQGYGQNTISWLPMGWQAQAGMTYRVTIGNLAGGDVTYDVKPIDCQ